MKIPGIRFYPQTVEVDTSGPSPIFLHDCLDEKKTDFECIFYPLWEYLQKKVVVWDFCLTIGEDPVPDLKRQFGDALLDLDLKGQLLFLNGSFISSWASEVRVYEGAFLTVFGKVPDHKLAQKLFWDDGFKLGTKNWPSELLVVIEMWDDIFWQIFSPDDAVLKHLALAHAENDRIKMYHVNIDDDSPDPRNEKLNRVKIGDFK